MPAFIDNALSIAAFRDEPIRAGPTLNRQRQLESLRRMEERIQSRRNHKKNSEKTREHIRNIFSRYHECFVRGMPRWGTEI